MARNGSGTASLLAPLAVANTVSSSTTVNATMDDVAEMLTDSINVDGTKAWEANQSLGGFKLTSMGAGSARTDNINMGQVQDGKANWVAAGGTADVITATYSPAITALVDGQECTFRASGANTVTTPTFSPNGLTARTIVKTGGSALAVGDIVGADHEVILKYKLASTRWEMVNASTIIADASETVKGKVELATNAEAITGTDTARAITPANLAAVLGAGSAVPSGVIVMYGAASAPTGYLLCDGTAVNRTTYAALFTAISTTYGVGDGSTTFNVPNLQSRIPVGYGTGTITETQAAANFATTDIITVNSNTQEAGTVKWQTGMRVQITTSGVLPTGISAATDYFVRRVSTTTISLYNTFDNAININDNANPTLTGRVNITATGSGNHTITHTLQNRALAASFGHELTGTVPAHTHESVDNTLSTDGLDSALTTAGYGPTAAVGETEGITNMPPSVVVNFIIKT